MNESDYTEYNNPDIQRILTRIHGIATHIQRDEDDKKILFRNAVIALKLKIASKELRMNVYLLQ